MEATKKSSVDYEEGYHRTRHRNHSDEQYYNARARIALKKFFPKVDKDTKLLDFGCGLGQNIYYLPNAVGYDVSEFGVAFSKEKGIAATNHLDDLADNSFDMVFSAHVLEHHPHPKTMLEDIHRKLKIGKQFILVIPYERHVRRGRFELDINQHLYCWNFQTINNLLLTTGFEINANKYIRGAGYHKLLPLAQKNFDLYWRATNAVSRLAGIKEMMITATKV